MSNISGAPSQEPPAATSDKHFLGAKTEWNFGPTLQQQLLVMRMRFKTRSTSDLSAQKKTGKRMGRSAKKVELCHSIGLDYHYQYLGLRMFF